MNKTFNCRNVIAGSPTLTRRAVMLGAALSTGALAVPVTAFAIRFGDAGGVPLAAVEDIASKVERLAHELSDALGQYYGGMFRAIVAADDDVILQNVRIGPKPRTASSSIDALYLEWLAIRNGDDLPETQIGSDIRHALYVGLQEAILAMTPASARDVAIQFVVETDEGDNDFRDKFFATMRALANGEQPIDRRTPVREAVNKAHGRGQI